MLWRGFNHPGEPPAGGEAERRKMQSVPRFRKDLNIVAVAPGGQFAAYAGLWFDPTNRLAYVEPVATDPDYRRLGLGKAAVQEGLRRCAALGADSAYVGNDLPIYRSIGFTRIYTTCCWEKDFLTARGVPIQPFHKIRGRPKTKKRHITTHVGRGAVQKVHFVMLSEATPHLRWGQVSISI